MQVALFIPCYVDQFYPHVGEATVEILERLNVNVVYPKDQTCCGQPLVNSGMKEEAKPIAKHFLKVFEKYEYVVCPSGSCTAMVRHHYEDLVGQQELSHRTYELCEFITDVLKVSKLTGKFPYTVGMHQSCHGLRELRLDQSSEIMTPTKSKIRPLLEALDEIKIATLKRTDECCGFGGLFSIYEESVSCSMGRDRLEDHQGAGVEVITSADMSCLMHLEGLARREKRPVKIMHIAEVLAEATR